MSIRQGGWKLKQRFPIKNLLQSSKRRQNLFLSPVLKPNPNIISIKINPKATFYDGDFKIKTAKFALLSLNRKRISKIITPILAWPMLLLKAWVVTLQNEIYGLFIDVLAGGQHLSCCFLRMKRSWNFCDATTCYKGIVCFYTESNR